MPKMLDHFQQCYFWLSGHFVHEKFGTRYSGHLLSRLAVYMHNLTKQTRFPTTWRGNRKSNSEPVNISFICDVWSSTVTTFINYEVDRRGGFCFRCPVGFKLGLGRLVDLGPSYGYACLSGNTDLEWVLTGQFLGVQKPLLGLPESSTITCLHWGRMWITCWWLDLLHLTTWESAAVEHHSPGWGRLLVVLSEDHDLCC